MEGVEQLDQPNDPEIETSTGTENPINPLDSLEEPKEYDIGEIHIKELSENVVDDDYSFERSDERTSPHVEQPDLGRSPVDASLPSSRCGGCCSCLHSFVRGLRCTINLFTILSSFPFDVFGHLNVEIC